MDETHRELHTESSEHAPFLATVMKLFASAGDAEKLEVADPEITARLMTVLMQHIIINAFVLGEGEESDRLKSGVGSLLANDLVRMRS